MFANGLTNAIRCQLVCVRKHSWGVRKHSRGLEKIRNIRYPCFAFVFHSQHVGKIGNGIRKHL